MKNKPNQIIDSFKKSWGRKEVCYNHFKRGKPSNQIQLAFQQHFSFIKNEIGIPKSGKVLEVGAGRGSLSSFFADSNYKTTLLDTSEEVLDVAKKIFKKNKLKNAEFIVGNAFDLPFDDCTFDVIASIGLMEHFKDIESLLKEQIRVLKRGGVFTAYIVPKKWSVQTVFKPVNNLLSKLVFNFKSKNKKNRVYRNKLSSEYYKEILKKLHVKKISSSGVYPFPAISFSPSFPFTLMPQPFEKALVKVYEGILKYRKLSNKKHPWACSEKWGQAFMIWCIKK